MQRRLAPHHSRWGAFNAVVEDGKVVGALPFDFDPDPSPLPCAQGNANVLTRDHGTSRLSQEPSSATALVEVERCAEPPPVRAFATPDLQEA